jgi:hypothetical protein
MNPFDTPLPDIFLAKLAQSATESQNKMMTFMADKDAEIARLREQVKILSPLAEQAEEIESECKRLSRELKSARQNTRDRDYFNEPDNTSIIDHFKTPIAGKDAKEIRLNLWQRAVKVTSKITGEFLDRYIILDDSGEVAHLQTNLIWRQNMEPGRYTFDEALAHARKVVRETGVAWRVPTREELETLLDMDARKNPCIDTIAFPDTPSTWFWSSSPYVDDSNYAWSVDFGIGYVSSYSSCNHSFALRLVRGG